ncbi:MAG: hypothetical protein RPS47_15375, partial [Colwellia sp.]
YESLRLPETSTFKWSGYKKAEQRELLGFFLLWRLRGVLIDLVLTLLYAARPFMLPTFSISLSVFA